MILEGDSEEGLGVDWKMQKCIIIKEINSNEGIRKENEGCIM